MQPSNNRGKQANGNRKKQGGRGGGRQQPPNNRPRVFGDYCFDYLKACKHNLGLVHTNAVASDNQSLSSLPGVGRKGSVVASVAQQSQSAITSSVSVAPCPLCILTNQMTRSFFSKESEQREIARLQSMRNRSILRTSLLHQWACSQSSLYYNMTNAINLSVDTYNVNDFTFDIFWSTSLMNCFIDCNVEKGIDFQDMIKVLQRRNRIYEVGYFAILMIQRQVRRFLTLKRMRKYLLTRFEYIPPTNVKKASYYDRERLRRCDRYPKLLLSMPHYHSATKFQRGFGINDIMEERSLAGTVTYGENPGTPRTIKRRLEYEEKLAKERLENYKKSLENLRDIGINVGRVKVGGPQGETDDVSILTLNSKKETSLNSFEDISFAMIKLEQQQIRQLKQFVILHDLVHVTMYRITLTMQYYQQVTTMVKKRMDSLGGSSAGGGVREGSKGDSEKSEKGSSDQGTVSPDHLTPVWLSPCAPGMSSRTLGLAIALLTTPSPSVMSDPTAPKTNTNNAPPILNRTSSSMSVASVASVKSASSSKQATSPKASASKRPTSAGNNAVQFYRALTLLEQYAFDALKCNTAEDVLKKLFLKDLIPVYESIVNITQDECGIWNSTYVNSSHPLLDGGVKSKPPLASSSASVTSASTTDYNLNRKRNNSYDDPDDASIGSTVSQDTLMLDPSLDDPDKEVWYEVLPFGIQLRPSIPDRSPAGLFRLFYFQEEVVAISSYSPWVCYPEVMKNKDVILGNIRKFVNSNNMRNFVQSYYRNVNHRNNNNPPPATSSGSRKMSVSTNSSKLPPSGKSGKANSNQVMQNALPPPSTFFAPAESMIFPGDDDTTLSKPKELGSYNDQGIILLGEKYKFLSTLSMFQERFKKAQANVGRRRQRKDNILGTRPISTAIGPPSDYEKQRLLFEQSSSFLKGKQVYELVKETLPPVPANKVQPKDKMVENMDDYSLALWKHATGVDLDIESRIIRPPDIIETNPPAIAQLFVVDLHVTLPKPKQLMTGRKLSTLSSGSDDSSSSVLVEIHQVIGLFPCNQDKCPANLDCGLFEFDHFYDMTKPKQTTTASNTSSNGPSTIDTTKLDPLSKTNHQGNSGSVGGAGNQISNVVTWTNPDPTTGVCLGRSMLPSGKEFQVKIIGNNPSREYLEENLPKKVKAWLGILPANVL